MFEARFRNWVRWCLSRGLHRGQAGSVEGGYRSGQVWDEVEPRGEEIDSVDAEVVNRAYAGIEAFARRVIKVMWFRGWWKDPWKAQKLGVNVRDLEETGLRAKDVLRSRLEYMESRSHTTRTVKPVSSPLGTIFP